jgi:hypothetical protein
MSVIITPADQDDARLIAATLEDGILAWPGYELRANSWPAPAVFVVPEAAAAKLVERLYQTNPQSAAVRSMPSAVPVAAAQVVESVPAPQEKAAPSPAPVAAPAPPVAKSAEVPKPSSGGGLAQVAKKATAKKK